MIGQILKSLLGLIILLLAGCTSLAGGQIQNGTLPTETLAAATPTTVWFPASATPTTQSLPTTKPTPDQKPGVGNILLSDDFSSAPVWNPAAADEAGVDLSQNRLTIAVQPGVFASRLRQDGSFNDFYAEVTARPSLCRDADDYGFLFRAPNNVAYYSFTLSCNGTARVERLSVGKPHLLQAAIPSSDVPPGAPGMVRLGVWAVGSDLRFFLNERYQFSVTDKNYASGAIGVFVRSAGSTPVTVSFSELVVRAVDYAPSLQTPQP
jgi:hypothetical protein